LWRHHSGTHRQDNADLSQDVFVRLFADGGKVLLSWDPAAGLSLAGFVRLVAQREVSSALRSRRRTPLAHDARDPVLLDEQVAPTTCSLDTRVHSRERLEQVVRHLSGHVSPRGMDIFRRLFVNRDSPQQVSSELRLTLVSVYQWRTRLARAVRQSVGSLAGLTTGTAPTPERT
jgi:DNA-directed RNA polymerase specialized sigma24 family protein